MKKLRLKISWLAPLLTCSVLIGGLCAQESDDNGLGIAFLGQHHAPDHESVLQAWESKDLSSLTLEREAFRTYLRSLPTVDRSPLPTNSIASVSQELPTQSIDNDSPSPLQPIIVDSQVQGASFSDANSLRANTTFEINAAGNSANKDSDSNGDEPATESLSSAVVEVTQDDLEERIEAQKKLITENDSIDEATKTGYFEQLNSASTSLQKAKSFRAGINDYEKKIASFESDMADYKKRLEVMSADGDLAPEATSDELQSQLQKKRIDVQEAKTKLEAISNSITQRETRMGQIPTLRNEAQEKLIKVDQNFADLADKPDDLAKQLSKLAIEARKLAIKNEIESLDAEVRRQEQVGKLLPIERDVLTKLVKRLEKEVTIWETAFDATRTAEIEKEKAEAKRIAMEAISANPKMSKIATRNKELLIQRENLTTKIQESRDELKEVEELQTQIDDKFSSLKKRIEKGLTTANGMLLVEHRQDLMQPLRSRSRINEITQELQKVRDTKSDIKERREEISDTEAVVQSIVTKTTDDEVVDPEEEAMARELATSQLKYLDSLDTDYDTYRGILVNISNANSSLIKKVNESKKYIDKNAMWLQSSEHLSVIGPGNDIQKSRTGLSHYFDFASWLQVIGKIKHRLYTRPLEYGIAGVLLIGIFIFNFRLRDRHA